MTVTRTSGKRFFFSFFFFNKRAFVCFCLFVVGVFGGCLFVSMTSEGKEFI